METFSNNDAFFYNKILINKLRRTILDEINNIHTLKKLGTLNKKFYIMVREEKLNMNYMQNIYKNICSRYFQCTNDEIIDECKPMKAAFNYKYSLIQKYRDIFHITNNFYINMIINSELRQLSSLCQIYFERNIKEFTLDELSKYDGSIGKPAYAAVSGIVYDISRVPAWGGGTHFGLIAGRDLTAEFKKCHDSSAILDNIPKVGVLA